MTAKSEMRVKKTLMTILMVGAVLLVCSISVFTPYLSFGHILNGYTNIHTRTAKNKKEACSSQKECIGSCSGNNFIMPGMAACQAYLNCSQIHSDITATTRIGNGYFKTIWLGKWLGQDVVYTRPTIHNEYYKSSVTADYENMKSLAHNYQVTQLIGFCEEDDTLVTEYFPLKDLSKINQLLQNEIFDSSAFRINMCLKYAKLLDFLHNSPIGTRSLCDTKTLRNTLSQYTLRDDFAIVANDLDLLLQPNQCIKIYQKRVTTIFTPPEMRNYTHFNTNIPIDEKIDIWKIPDVCDFMLGDFKIQLPHSTQKVINGLHGSCKNERPDLRPSARNVSHQYESVLEML